MAKNRDDFSQRTKDQIAKRAGWLCSFPACRVHTVGATEDGQGEINIGIAAHICAAAPGGPRYDDKMLPEDRSSPDNGIWLCQNHAKIIDSDATQYTLEILREWKRQAAEDSLRRVVRNEAAPAPAVVKDDADIKARLHEAALKDLNVFRETAKWPRTAVPLTLEIEDFETPVTTAALSRVVTTLEDLILVAGPGMGKTTTLFQVAAGVVEGGSGAPLIVLLNDWATEGSTILEAILKRPAFKGISKEDFYKAAAQPGVVLLLDGWNELDADARKRARLEVMTLKAELPELGLVVSARQPRNQALDVPFMGKRVDLLPLNDEQQMQIATAMRGNDGVKLIDEAWRTAGVRELVSIPLYLSALLSLPKGAPFPTTKEEVLRHFVTAHEKEAVRAEALYAVVQDFQQDYLEGLATFATRTAKAGIADADARRCVSQTTEMLTEQRQIKTGPEPNAILDVLVSSHMLMRAGNMPGVSFQHQQFQEWYASHSVERHILAEVDDPKKCDELKANVFNFPAWEEAILFAIERISRGSAHQQAACGKAILAAFEVDPILAAEMIFRATEEVWALVSKPIQAFVARWHAVGKVDRALRFMLTSGRHEFLGSVWPLITHEDSQVSLKALRNCKRFRPSILGKDAAKIIKALPKDPREVLLNEIAFNSGMDGLELATNIAKDDPEPEVKATVVGALAFRRADRHAAEILRHADVRTFDLVARREYVNRFDDKNVQDGIVAARKRMEEEETTADDRIRLIAHAEDQEDRSDELTEIIATMEIDRKDNTGTQYIYQARNRYPRAVANGLLARVRTGNTLFYGSDDILASSGLIFEDHELLQIALANTAVNDERANAAASVLGPQAVGKMIDVLLELLPRVRSDRSASVTYSEIEGRVADAPVKSLVTAILERSAALSSEQMAYLTHPFSRRADRDNEGRGPFDADTLVAIQGLVQDWGSRMLASNEAQRRHKASVATLASCAPTVGLLPLLKELLDDNLRRYRDFRIEAEASGWQRGNAVDEARSSHADEFKRAFLAIKAPETAALMSEYLEDEHFGALAAFIIADQWRSANIRFKDRRWRGDVDFSDVKERRIALARNPGITCEEAEVIFAAIDRLIAVGSSKKQQMLAVALAVRTLDLPHGRRDASIRRLLELAPRKGYENARSDILLRLVLAGEELDLVDVSSGINETLEAAKTDWGILNESDGYQLRVWLRLLPFVRNPIEALYVIQNLPDEQRAPRFLQEMVRVSAYAPAEKVEDFLFSLAEQDPRFYLQHEWHESVMALGTESSARRLIDLVANGALSKNSSLEDWHWVRRAAGLFSEHSALRGHVYELLRNGVTSPGLAMLAGAVAENPDEEGLMLLVMCEQKGRSFRAFRMLEKAVTEHVPIDGTQAYNVIPVPAVELRRKLLAMTTDGGPKDIAARWLNDIDNVRDEWGLPEEEPRHPDWASSKPWPIMAPDPDATKE